MDFRSQSNRPAPRATSNDRPAAAQTSGTETPPHHINVNGNRAGKKRFAFAAAATVVLLGAGFVLGQFTPALAGEYSRVDKSKNQAVFLTNDQVYFGKITSINDDVIVMKDIYYLQKGSEQSGDAKQDAKAPTAQQSNLSLAKLGNELHAPEDRMQINKDQVLFWENLKSDGKVSKAIEEYTKK